MVMDLLCLVYFGLVWMERFMIPHRQSALVV
jgi:hypothetical protein